MATKTMLGGLWAGAILVAAVAAALDFIGQDMAEGLYYGLLIGAAASLGQARCRSC